MTKEGRPTDNPMDHLIHIRVPSDQLEKLEDALDQLKEITGVRPSRSELIRSYLEQGTVHTASVYSSVTEIRSGSRNPVLDSLDDEFFPNSSREDSQIET